MSAAMSATMLTTKKIIPFYSHTKSNYKCFSQFSRCRFTIDSIEYNCAEQWMMASKARTFTGNDNILAEILQNNDPAKIKGLGRKVQNYDEQIWSRVRYEVVVKGNYAKFSQNDNLKKILLDTKDAILVEASPYDRIWGVGLGIDNPDVNNPAKWIGQNLLGKALMEVREQLASNLQNN
jgi:ribA/ribD-fused uncharacterized protein